VPASFNELSPQEHHRRAEMAGLKCRVWSTSPPPPRLPRHSQGVQGRILVFDMGGGTLDTTILERGRRQHPHPHLRGARHLGGGDFDDILLEAYSEQMQEAGLSAALYNDERQRRRALQAAEDSKKCFRSCNA